VSVRNRSVSDRHHETRSQVLCYVDHRRYETVSILGPVGVPSPTPRFLPNRAFTPPANSYSHGSNLSVSISLTFDPVTNTPPRTVTVIFVVVPLARLGPASEIGCVGDV
jgi:hypothetical protein